MDDDDALLAQLAMWLAALPAEVPRDQRFGAELSVAQLELFVPDAIEALRSNSHRLVLFLALAGPSGYYVQALAKEDGDVCAECVSNKFVAEGFKLTDEQEEQLPALGYSWPAPPSSPNWQVSDPLLSSGGLISRLFMRTLREVLHAQESDIVNVTVYDVGDRMQVTLRSERSGRDLRTLWARLDADGNLHVDGQDLGPGTAPVSSDGEYEWFQTIRRESIPQLLVLLGAPPDTRELLQFLKANFSGTSSYELERILRESKVPVERTVW